MYIMCVPNASTSLFTPYFFLLDFTVRCMGCINRRTCAGPSLRLYWKRNMDHVNGYLDVVTNGVGVGDIRTEYGWDVHME